MLHTWPMLGPLAAAILVFAQLPGDVVIPGSTPEETPAPGDVETPRLTAVSVVVLDPGHGGDDGGAKDPARDTVEKALTLAIAKKVEAKFAALAMGSGARLLLTRDGDERVANSARGSLANEARADLFVSVHANASPSPAARGFHVAYHDSAGAELALTRPRDARSAPLPARPWIASQRPREEESARFAEILRESLAAKVQLPDRGVKRIPLSALEGAGCPAVLVEVGYLTNTDDGLALSTDAVQDAVAEAIAESILRMDGVLAGASAERSP